MSIFVLHDELITFARHHFDCPNVNLNVLREMHLFWGCFWSFWGSDWGLWGHECAAWAPWTWLRLDEVVNWVWVRILATATDFNHSEKVIGEMLLFWGCYWSFWGSDCGP